jgi:hypothetical protein
MSVATEKISEVQDQVLDLVSRVQEPVVRGLGTVADKVEDRIPEVTIPTLSERAPAVSEVLEALGGLVESLVENQKQFVGSVLDATAPVRHKVVIGTPAPKPAAKTSTTKAKAA